jgi:hypothetical protein
MEARDCALLSNIVLDELDNELSQRGHRFVRYADDCNIYVRSERAGKRVMASVTNFIESRLWLKVNVTKSAVARPEERHFLGFRLRREPMDGSVEVLLSKRSKERINFGVKPKTAWQGIYWGRRSWWALSHSTPVDRGLRNAYFAKRGLVSLESRWREFHDRTVIASAPG